MGRRRVAPQARREVAKEIAADTLGVRRAWIRAIEHAGRTRETVVVQVAVGRHLEVACWLNDPDSVPGGGEVLAQWLFFPDTLAAILACAVRGPAPWRFNIAFNAGGGRRHLETIAGSGLLGITTVPLRLTPDQRPATPVRFIPVPTGPLRAFLLTQRPPER